MSDYESAGPSSIPEEDSKAQLTQLFILPNRFVW